MFSSIKINSEEHVVALSMRLTLKRAFQNHCCLFLLVLMAAYCLGSQPAKADLSFSDIWGRSGTIGVRGAEPSRWVLATTDTDENVLYTSTNGPEGATGISAGSDLRIFFNDFTIFSPGIDVADLGGEAITTEPHSLDAGTWAYGMALLDWPGPLEFRQPVVQSYFQMRLAGSSAVVQDTALAQQAVLAGRWPSIDTYIEFNPQWAVYFANNTNPISPSDYTGTDLPECSSATLMIIGLATGLLRRKQRTTKTM
jgi:hypothetical protein